MTVLFVNSSARNHHFIILFYFIFLFTTARMQRAHSKTCGQCASAGKHLDHLGFARALQSTGTVFFLLLFPVPRRSRKILV
jgi:hypothetical protein